MCDIRKIENFILQKNAVRQIQPSIQTYNGYILQWIIKLFLDDIKTTVRAGFLTWPFESRYLSTFILQNAKQKSC